MNAKNPIRRFTGVVHVHSRISYDGRERIADLARYFKSRGRDFMCITEHSDGLAKADMRRIVDECAAASEDGFLAVPGVEFSCVRHLHILGVGVVEPIASDDPFEVCAHIRSQRGTAILAHPCAYEHYLPEGIHKHIDGVEVWSLPKDGKLAPGAEPMQLWRQWSKENPALRGIGAIDLHGLDSPSGVAVELSLPALTIEAVIAGLRDGPITIRGPLLSVSGQSPPFPLHRMGLNLANRTYDKLRKLRSRIRRRLRKA